MDYCTYGHMIDNVVLIVTGTLHERDVQVRLHCCGHACMHWLLAATQIMDHTYVPQLASPARRSFWS